MIASHRRLRVESEHKFIGLRIEDILRDIKMWHFAHAGQNRYITLAKLEKRAVFNLAAEQLVTDEDPLLSGSVVLVIPDGRPLREVALQERLGAHVVGQARGQVIHDAVHCVSWLLTSDAQVFLESTCQGREDGLGCLLWAKGNGWSCKRKMSIMIICIKSSR